MTTALTAASTQLALMPDFLDPMKLLGYFGTWALVGMLVVIFVESGLLFPILPGDSLLFVGGMLAAGTAAIAEDGGQTVNFQLWQLLVFIPIAAILGGQVGYWIGRNVGTAMFKPDAKLLKQKYLDEAHAFFEQRGPFAIVIARFVPIVRTLAPLVAGAARMNYAVFTIYNIIGAVVWGIGLVESPGPLCRLPLTKNVGVEFRSITSASWASSCTRCSTFVGCTRTSSSNCSRSSPIE